MPSVTHRNGAKRARADAAAEQLKKWREQKKLRSFAAAGRELNVPWSRYGRWELGECVPLGADMAMLEKK